MEIKNTLTGLNPYERTKLDKAEGDKARQKRDTGATQSSKGDHVEFSDEASLRAEAFKVASNTSDVRSDKVEMLKAKIAAGEYEVDSRKIAENLIRDDLDLNS